MRVSLCIAPAALLLCLAAGPGRADDAEVSKVLDRAIKAHGGAENLGKFKAATSKFKGKFYGMSDDGIETSGEFSVQAPDKLRQEITVDVMGTEFKLVRVVNGARGWVQMMGTTKAMDKDTLAEAKEDLYVGHVRQLVVLRGKGFKLTPVGEVKVDGRPAVGIQVTHTGHRDINLFFDKTTNLLVKTEHPVKDPMSGKEFTQEERFSDYKKVGGVPHAHKLVILRDGKKFVEGEISDFQPQEKLDDSTFAKP